MPNPSRAQSSRQSRAPTCSSTRTIRSTGTRGATRRSRGRAARTSRSSCRSATRPVTGATSWSTRASRTPSVADAAEPALRVDQGRSRGAAGRRPRLHDVRAGDDRVGRLADERVAHADAAAVLRRHLLSADRRDGAGPGFVDMLAGDRARLAGGARQGAAVRGDHRRAAADDAARDGGGRCRPGADVLDARRRASSPPRSTRGAAASATRRSFRGRASCSSCCASTRGRARPSRATWRS